MLQIDNPYADLSGGSWLRGNLHAHTNRTDGTRDAQTVIDGYAALGYDFLALTDHDMLTGPAEYAAWDSRGLVLIPGNEITANGVHICHINAPDLVPPTANRQTAISAIAKGDGFAVINHANWLSDFNHCPIECLAEWKGYTGIEIFNGVVTRLEGSPYATNKWDMMLSQGRKVWGFANDDSHDYGDDARGWNVVYTHDRSVEAIVAALRAGRFYASTGVVIDDIAVSAGRIRVQTRNARRIVALMQNAVRIATTDRDTIDIAVPETAKCVRFECWGEGESFAWTQPFFVNA